MTVSHSVEIRWLRPGDEATLCELYMSLQRGMAPEPSAVAALLAGGVAEVLCASADGRPAGWAVTYLLPHVDGTQMVLLFDLEVLPEYRRRGIGRALVAEVRRHSVDERRRKLWLMTPRDNTPAVELYRDLHGVETNDVLFVWTEL